MNMTSSIAFISWPSLTAWSENFVLPFASDKTFSMFFKSFIKIYVYPAYIKFGAVCACQFINSF